MFWNENAVVYCAPPFIEVDGLVAVNLKPAVDLRSVERLRFLLCNPDEDDLAAHVHL
jgi:hypothetical protein